MSWIPRFEVVCDRHGVIFESEFEINIVQTIKTHHRYNPSCKLEVKGK